MKIPEPIAELVPEMIQWRHDLHAHPQTAFEETYASERIAGLLNEWGLHVHRGMAQTGVVGTLQGRRETSGQLESLGLRADIDALDILEQTELEYASRYPGKMHACGHDGHTAMLLGAARYLAETRNFAGTVHFVFQPAEENEGGGRVMVQEGLFERFPVDAVFGMHNWPSLPLGTFAAGTGPVMAAYDVFTIRVRGIGAHAAMPQNGIDPIVAGAQIVQTLQTIVSRTVDPADQAVVTVTQFHAGDTWNVIPPEAELRGTVRTFRAATQDRIETRLREIAQHVGSAVGAQCTVEYERRYPATVNTSMETDWATRAASDVVGEDHVDCDPRPCMGSEDFAFMLQERPGCYIWAGAGDEEHRHGVHHPQYDFNDRLLPIGAAYWIRLVERLLG